MVWLGTITTVDMSVRCNNSFNLCISAWLVVLTSLTLEDTPVIEVIRAE